MEFVGRFRLRQRFVHTLLVNVVAPLFCDPNDSFHRFQCLLPAPPNVGSVSLVAVGCWATHGQEQSIVTAS